MAETIKKGVIKSKTDASNTVILYPKTTADQVEYESKTYTGLIGTSNEFKNASFYFINVKPNNWNKEWTIIYRLEVNLDSGSTPSNYQKYSSTHECYIGGSRGYYQSYAFFNSINDTSYRPVFYNLLHETTETGFNNNYPHKIGVELTSSASPTDTNYKRTIKVTILKATGCTATLLSTPEIPAQSTRSDYTKISSTYYPNGADSNNPGYAWRGCLYYNGLQETGDSNDVDRLYYHNQWIPISSNLGLPGYSIFGFNPAGEIMSISIANPSSPAQSDAVTTNRSYNSGGFDWTRGLFRWTSGGYYAPSTTNLIHADKVVVQNFKYTDNLVNSANTTLTMTANKYVYLRGTIGGDGLFYLAPMEVTYNSATYKKVWTQDPPSTEDGYVYWLVGHAYSGSSATENRQDVRVYAENPLYWYKNGKFREYDGQVVHTMGNETISGTKTFFYQDDPVYANYTAISGNKIELSYYNSGYKQYETLLTPEKLSIDGLYADLNLESNASKFGIHLDAGDGGNVPIEFNLSDAYNNDYTLIVPYKDGTIATIGDFATETSKYQASSVVVGNAITNINGRVFQNYTANLVTAGGYTFYQILKNGNNPTEDEAKEYMRYMTGSLFLPTYNYDFPKQTIFTFADRSTWKPQYSSSDGLRLYRLTTPLALESDIPADSNLVHLTGTETISGSKTFTNATYFDTVDNEVVFSGIAPNFYNGISIGNINNDQASGAPIYLTHAFEHQIYDARIWLQGLNLRYTNSTAGSGATPGDVLFPVPDSTGANKTIATVDQIPDDSNLVHKGTNSSSVTETIYGEKKFGSTVRFGAYNAGAAGFLSEGSISSSSLISMNIDAVYSLNLSANGNPGIAMSGFSFKDYYKPSGSSTTYTSTYKFPDKTAANKSYTIATTDDLTGFVHKGSSSTASNEDIYGTKTFKSGGVSFSNTIGSNTYNSWISADLSNLAFRTRKGSYDLTQGNVIVNIPTINSSAQNISINFPTTSGTVALDENVVHNTGDTMTGSLILNAGSGYSSSPNIAFVTPNGGGSLYKSDETLYFDHTGVHSYTLTFPMNSGTVALTSQIPSTSNFVTTNTSQQISGSKWFSNTNMPTGFAQPNAPLTTTEGLAINKNGIAISGKNNNTNTYLSYDFPAYSGTGTKAFTLASTDDLPQILDLR